MFLETLALLILFASVFALTAGLSRDSKFLVPMGGILVLAASMLLTSNTLMVQDGFVETSNLNMTSNSTLEQGSGPFQNDVINVSEKTDVLTERTPTYEDLNDVYSIGELSLSGSIAFILMAIALYSFILAYLRSR